MSEGQAAEGVLVSLVQLSPGLLPAALFETVPGAAAPALLDRELLAKTLGMLESAGELEREGERLRVPEAVRERVLADLDYQASVKATEEALALVLAAFPGDPGDYANWKRAQALMPELRAAIGRARELEIESPRVPLALALGSEFLTASGEFALANVLADEAFIHASSSLEPAIRATMSHAQGVILAELGELEQARRALEEAHDTRTRAGEAGTVGLRADLLALGEVLGELGNFEAARRHLEMLRAPAEVPDDRFDVQARRRLAWLLMEEREFELSETAYREAMEATQRLFGADHPDTALVHGELGALLLEVSRWEEARSELEQALESACALLGDNHPAVGVIASNLGGALEGLERFEDAREAVERSLAIGHAVLPDGHRNLWLRHRKLARILRALDEYEAAREHAEAAASISERALSTEDPEAARDQLALAALLQRTGEPASARGRYESALAVLEAAEYPSSPEIVDHQLTFGGLLIELGDLVAARSPIESALVNSEAADGGDDSVRARIALLKLAERLSEELAAALELQGRGEEAKRVRDSDRESRQAVLNELVAEERIGSSLLAARAAGAAMPDLAGVALAQARTLAEAEEDAEEREQDLLVVRLTWSSLGLDAFTSADYEASRHFYETALELAAGDPTAEGEALSDLADIAGAEGDDARAVEIYREALARLRTGGGDEVEYTLLLLGRAHKRLEQYEEAKACFLERLEILRAASAPQPGSEAVTVHDLASVHLACGEVELAIDLYSEAVELKRQTSNSAELATTLRSLGSALREAGRVDEAADAYAECAQLLRELPDSDPMSEAVVLQEYADLRRESGDLESAEDLYRRAISRAGLELDPLHLSFLLYGLAAVLQRRGNLPDAEAALRRRLEILADVEGVGWQEGITLVDLGRVREESGDLLGAVALYRDAVAKLAPEDAPRLHGFALQRLGDVLTKSEELGQSAVAYQEAFDVWSAGGEPDLASRVLLDLGRAQYSLNDFSAAARSFEKRIDLLGQAEERNPRAEGFTFHDLADVRKAEGRLSDAISLYREAVARKREGEGDVELAASLTLLAITLLETGEGQEVAALTEEAIGILCAEPDPNPSLLGSAIALFTFATPVDHGGLIAAGVERLRKLLEEGSSAEAVEPLLEVLQTLGRKATADGNLDDAEGYFRERLSLLAVQPDSGPNPEGITKHELARALGLAGKSDEAVALYREAAELKREAGNGLGVARTNFALAAQLRKEKDEEAQEVAARSVEQFRKQPDADPAELSAALSLLALLEDDDQHALATLGEAKELVDSMPEDGEQTEFARQGIARAEEKIRHRHEQPG